RRISRFALGDPTIPTLVQRIQMPFELPQDQHNADLPLGTRGGSAIRTYVPVDGEYDLEIEAAKGRSLGTYGLEVSVDGSRVRLLETETKRGRYEGSPFMAVGDRLNVTLALKAGPRKIGVTFLEKPDVPEEGFTRPASRSFGQTAAIITVTVTGPRNASGSGDTPSRRRILTCRP